MSGFNTHIHRHVNPNRNKNVQIGAIVMSCFIFVVIMALVIKESMSVWYRDGKLGILSIGFVFAAAIGFGVYSGIMGLGKIQVFKNYMK